VFGSLVNALLCRDVWHRNPDVKMLNLHRAPGPCSRRFKVNEGEVRVSGNCSPVFKVAADVAAYEIDAGDSLRAIARVVEVSRHVPSAGETDLMVPTHVRWSAVKGVFTKRRSDTCLMYVIYIEISVPFLGLHGVR
jgi:hypothetical protein